MEYIVSKPKVQDNASDMQNSHWFNIWSNLNWPYEELLQNDILYFYDTKKRYLSWKNESR